MKLKSFSSSVAIELVLFVCVFLFSSANGNSIVSHIEKPDGELSEQFLHGENNLAPNDSSFEVDQVSENHIKATELLGANYPELCKNRSRRSDIDFFDFNQRNQFDTMNQIFKGGCIKGFQLFGNVCITSSINSCIKSTFQKMFDIDSFDDLANLTIDISMIDYACDPKRKHKDKNIGIAEVESIIEMKDLMVIYDLSESSPCTNSGYFIKVYNNVTCRYEPALLQKVNGSFYIERNFDEARSKAKYDFICKYNLQPMMSKLSKREKEDMKQKSAATHVSYSSKLITALLVVFFFLMNTYTK